MRITYRGRSSKDYWSGRWASIPVDNPMKNEDAYPLKYALQTVTERGRILEAGCGVGRILRFFHQRGDDIIGIDFIEGAIAKLQEADETLKVQVGDIKNLPFPENYFRFFLAFGLFHGLESGLEQAVKETNRVIMPGGRLCASFRADNFHTRLLDWQASRKSKHSRNEKLFHKRNLTRKEFEMLFDRAGFKIESITAVENMPLLYKFELFRAASHKNFDENRGREEGYQLSKFGGLLQSFLMKWFPNQFCNIYVMIAAKP